MSLVVGAAWLILAAIWQTAALPVPSMLGAPADIAPLIILMWAYVRSPEDAVVLALIGGLTIDVAGNQPPGITVLALLPATVVGSIRGARMLDTEWLSTILLAFTATFAYHIVLIALLSLTGEALSAGAMLRQQALPASVLSAVLAPPLYFLVWAASFDVRPSRRQIRTSD